MSKIHYKGETLEEEEEINSPYPAVNQEQIIFPGLALTGLWITPWQKQFQFSSSLENPYTYSVQENKVLKIHALKLNMSHLWQNRYVNVSWRANVGICVRLDWILKRNLIPGKRREGYLMNCFIECAKFSFPGRLSASCSCCYSDALQTVK